MNLINSLMVVSWLSEVITEGPRTSARVGAFLLIQQITKQWPATFRRLVVRELMDSI